MFARNATSDRPICGILGCEEPARIRGLCSACYSAWLRMRDKTAAQAKVYIYRTKRIAARIPELIGARKSDNPHWGAAAEAEESHGRRSAREADSRPRPPLEARTLDGPIVTRPSSKRRATA